MAVALLYIEFSDDNGCGGDDGGGGWKGKMGNSGGG